MHIINIFKYNIVDRVVNYKCFIDALGGGNGKAVNECLPDEFKNESLAGDATNDTSLNMWASVHGILSKVVLAVRLIIKATCFMFKGALISIFSMIQSSKRYKRRFIEKHSRSIANRRFPGYDTFVSIKENIYQAVEKVKHFVQTPIFIAFKTKITACATSVPAIALNTLNVSKAVGLLTSSGGSSIPAMIVGSLCNWEAFLRAFDYLSAALTEKIMHLKWLQIGKFCGQLLVLFGLSATF